MFPVTTGDIPDVSDFVTSGGITDFVTTGAITDFVTSGAIPDVSSFVTSGAIPDVSSFITDVDYASVAAYFDGDSAWVSLTKDADTQLMTIGHTGILSALINGLATSVSDLQRRVSALESS